MNETFCDKKKTDQLVQCVSRGRLQERVFQKVRMTYFGTEVYSEADYIGGFASRGSHLHVGEAKSQD